MGPKLAARLASLGLLLVRDLLCHYPRDHVDYSAMRRIEALVAGETATIVATVRRATVRQPPKPQPGDPGTSASGPHRSPSHYPVSGRKTVQLSRCAEGAAAAVSRRGQGCRQRAGQGGGYRITVHDPLIEVLDGADSTVRSQAIGRLLPVYPLTEGWHRIASVLWSTGLALGMLVERAA